MKSMAIKLTDLYLFLLRRNETILETNAKVLPAPPYNCVVAQQKNPLQFHDQENLSLHVCRLF